MSFQLTAAFLENIVHLGFWSEKQITDSGRYLLKTTTTKVYGAKGEETLGN